MPDLSASLSLLTSPAILFFLIGVLAALARSDLAVPERVARALSLYPMSCIGFKGGAGPRAAVPEGDLLIAATLGLGLSAVLPLLALFVLGEPQGFEAKHSRKVSHLYMALSGFELPRKRDGDPGGTRTPDLCFRKALLYPAELRDHASVN